MGAEGRTGGLSTVGMSVGQRLPPTDLLRRRFGEHNGEPDASLRRSKSGEHDGKRLGVPNGDEPNGGSLECKRSGVGDGVTDGVENGDVEFARLPGGTGMPNSSLKSTLA